MNQMISEYGLSYWKNMNATIPVGICIKLDDYHFPAKEISLYINVMSSQIAYHSSVYSDSPAEIGLTHSNGIQCTS